MKTDKQYYQTIIQQAKTEIKKRKVKKQYQKMALINQEEGLSIETGSMIHDDTTQEILLSARPDFETSSFHGLFIYQSVSLMSNLGPC